MRNIYGFCSKCQATFDIYNSEYVKCPHCGRWFKVFMRAEDNNEEEELVIENDDEEY